jgi:hypothetical protein
VKKAALVPSWNVFDLCIRLLDGGGADELALRHIDFKVFMSICLGGYGVAGKVVCVRQDLPFSAAFAHESILNDSFVKEDYRRHTVIHVLFVCLILIDA